MSHHPHPDLRTLRLLDGIARDYRASRAEVRETIAILERILVPKPKEPLKIVIERSPWPNAEPQYLWAAYYEGQEDELSRNGATPEEALGRFLNAVNNGGEPEEQS